MTPRKIPEGDPKLKGRACSSYLLGVKKRFSYLTKSTAELSRFLLGYLGEKI